MTTTYHVRHVRASTVVSDFGRTMARVPKQALYRLAAQYIKAGWQYADTLDGSGQLTNPADLAEHVEAMAEFPDDAVPQPGGAA